MLKASPRLANSVLPKNCVSTTQSWRRRNESSTGRVPVVWLTQANLVSSLGAMIQPPSDRVTHQGRVRGAAVRGHFRKHSPSMAQVYCFSPGDSMGILVISGSNAWQ